MGVVADVVYFALLVFLLLLIFRLIMEYVFLLARSYRPAGIVAVVLELAYSVTDPPLKALRRVYQGGWAYWHAWAIALSALSVSFAGLLAFGFGFLVTSVWFWQVAGYSFATVFTRRFGLQPS